MHVKAKVQFWSQKQKVNYFSYSNVKVDLSKPDIERLIVYAIINSNFQSPESTQLSCSSS